MLPPRTRWSPGRSNAMPVVVLALGTALASPYVKPWFPKARSPLEGLVTTEARRVDLGVTLTNMGKIETMQRTEIKCDLQRLGSGGGGSSSSSGGSSTMLSVIPDGTMVKKGDVLCTFDSSEYDESLRQQQIAVKRAQAEHNQAELNLDVALMAVKEYKEGVMVEAFKQHEGVVALGAASLEQSGNRLQWARRMLEKGYYALSQLSNEEFNYRKAALQLKKSRTNLEVFRRFTAPRSLKSLEGRVFAAEAMMKYHDQRLRQSLEREELLKKQVELCTIRAPHDGLLIYAYDQERQIRIEEGMSVRRRQDLFYLPDLTRMHAVAMIHESVASRVEPGMPARVRIEAMPGVLIEGRVKSVAQLATRNSVNDVRYFYTQVSLDHFPDGLMPGMTVEVEIATEFRPDILAIPLEAVAYERGRRICYVARGDKIERREIRVGQSNRRVVEVTEGLAEGERVVLNSLGFEAGPRTLSPFNDRLASDWIDARRSPVATPGRPSDPTISLAPEPTLPPVRRRAQRSSPRPPIRPDSGGGPP